MASTADGPGAIDVAATFHPDVGVLDIGLPGISGYELARRLREMHPHIRLIALTATVSRSIAKPPGWPASTRIVRSRLRPPSCSIGSPAVNRSGLRRSDQKAA